MRLSRHAALRDRFQSAAEPFTLVDQKLSVSSRAVAISAAKLAKPDRAIYMPDGAFRINCLITMG